MSKQYDPQKLSSYINAPLAIVRKKTLLLKLIFRRHTFRAFWIAKRWIHHQRNVWDVLLHMHSNGITYAQLLDAAGYAPIPESPRLSTSDHTFFQGTILTALSALQIPFKKESLAEKEFDLSISFQQASISHWYFRFLENSTESTAKQQMTTIYNSLVFCLAPTDKISIATSQTSEFDHYADRYRIWILTCPSFS